MSRPFQEQSFHAARRVPLGNAQRRGARDDQGGSASSGRRNLASASQRVARVLNWLCAVVRGREPKPKDDVGDAASSLENSISPAMNLRGDAGGIRLSDVERTLLPEAYHPPIMGPSVISRPVAQISHVRTAPLPETISRNRSAGAWSDVDSDYLWSRIVPDDVRRRAYPSPAEMPPCARSSSRIEPEQCFPTDPVAFSHAALSQSLLRDLERRISDHDEVGLAIDVLDGALLAAPTSHGMYGSGVRRLRRWCRDFARLPTTCYPIEIRDIELVSDKPLFTTALSDVFRGMYGGTTVTVKSLRVYHGQHALNSAQKAFLNEVVTWRHLRHPNIVPFLGICNQSSVCLVSEWMTEGTLAEFLQRNPTEYRTSYILGMVYGLDFMHSLGVIHGDIKAVNVLVDLNRNARLADFGLASTFNQATMAATNLAGGGANGTVRWIAPELLDVAKPRTDVSDVYALAMTIVEVFTCKVPFFEVGIDIVVLQKVLSGERPSKPTNCKNVGFSDELWDLMQQSWAAEPKSRASLADFIRVLR